MNLILNTYLMGERIEKQFDKLSQSYESEVEARKDNKELFEIRSLTRISMTTLRTTGMLSVILCTVLLPFLQYLLNLGRVYEIGVLRALGMGKARAWVRLFIENIVLMGTGFILAGFVTLAVHRRFALKLLAIDDKERALLLVKFGADIIFGYNLKAMLITLYAAAVMTLISSMLLNAVISGTAPLKLIRKSK